MTRDNKETRLRMYAHRRRSAITGIRKRIEKGEATQEEIERIEIIDRGEQRRSKRRTEKFAEARAAEKNGNATPEQLRLLESKRASYKKRETKSEADINSIANLYDLDQCDYYEEHYAKTTLDDPSLLTAKNNAENPGEQNQTSEMVDLYDTLVDPELLELFSPTPIAELSSELKTRKTNLLDRAYQTLKKQY